MLLSLAARGQVFAVAAVGVVGSATMSAGSGSLGVDKRESVPRRVREGMVMMLRLPELRGVLALNLALAAPTALVLVNTVVLVRGQLGRSESDVAVLLGACGAGAIVMAMLIPPLRLHVTMLGGAGGAVAGLLGFCLLIDAAPATRRTHIQGRSDFTMNIVGASGGAVAGPIVHNWGMPTLASLTGFLIIVAVVVLLPRVCDISTR